jgi:hypothetical protein
VMVFQTVDVYEAHGNSDQKIDFMGVMILLCNKR